MLVLPAHLDEEKLSVKLIGESCVPEIAIVEPLHGSRESGSLKFPRTLINEVSYRQFALENIGFVKAKIIVEIDEDQNGLFGFSATTETRRFLQILDNDCPGEFIRFIPPVSFARSQSFG